MLQCAMSDCRSAELSKLAANAFLAQRISSINAMSALCEVGYQTIQRGRASWTGLNYCEVT